MLWEWNPGEPAPQAAATSVTSWPLGLFFLLRYDYTLKTVQVHNAESTRLDESSTGI